MTMSRAENRAMAAATRLAMHHDEMVTRGMTLVPAKGTHYRVLLDELQAALVKAAKAEFKDDPMVPDEIPES